MNSIQSNTKILKIAYLDFTKYDYIRNISTNIIYVFNKVHKFLYSIKNFKNIFIKNMNEMEGSDGLILFDNFDEERNKNIEFDISNGHYSLYNNFNLRNIFKRNDEITTNIDFSTSCIDFAGNQKISPLMELLYNSNQGYILFNKENDFIKTVKQKYKNKNMFLKDIKNPVKEIYRLVKLKEYEIDMKKENRASFKTVQNEYFKSVSHAFFNNNLLSCNYKLINFQLSHKMILDNIMKNFAVITINSLTLHYETIRKRRKISVKNRIKIFKIYNRNVLYSKKDIQKDKVKIQPIQKNMNIEKPYQDFNFYTLDKKQLEYEKNQLDQKNMNIEKPYQDFNFYTLAKKQLEYEKKQLEQHFCENEMEKLQVLREQLQHINNMINIENKSKDNQNLQNDLRIKNIPAGKKFENKNCDVIQINKKPNQVAENSSYNLNKNFINDVKNDTNLNYQYDKMPKQIYNNQCNIINEHPANNQSNLISNSTHNVNITDKCTIQNKHTNEAEQVTNNKITEKLSNNQNNNLKTKEVINSDKKMTAIKLINNLNINVPDNTTAQPLNDNVIPEQVNNNLNSNHDTQTPNTNNLLETTKSKNDEKKFKRVMNSYFNYENIQSDSDSTYDENSKDQKINVESQKTRRIAHISSTNINKNYDVIININNKKQKIEQFERIRFIFYDRKKPNNLHIFPIDFQIIIKNTKNITEDIMEFLENFSLSTPNSNNLENKTSTLNIKILYKGKEKNVNNPRDKYIIYVQNENVTFSEKITIQISDDKNIWICVYDINHHDSLEEYKFLLVDTKCEGKEFPIVLFK